MRPAYLGLSLLAIGQIAGCASVGVLQTAHTVAPQHARVSLGVNRVDNRVVSENRSEDSETIVPQSLAGSFVESSVRLGLTNHLDAGLSYFDLFGLALDAKCNLFAPHQAFALAPRLGVGFAVPALYSHAVAKAGLIASYRMGPVEPYVAATYSNHWVWYYESLDPPPPGERYVARNGVGNGLLETTVGVDLRLGERVGMIGEVTRAIPLNDDPGDRFQYVPSTLFVLAMRFQRN